MKEIEKISEFHFEYEEQFHLIKELFGREEVFEHALENHQYHTIILYVYNLAKLFSAFYNNVSILSESDTSKKLSHLFLVLGYIQTLENVFEILSIKLPKKM